MPQIQLLSISGEVEEVEFQDQGSVLLLTIYPDSRNASPRIIVVANEDDHKLIQSLIGKQLVVTINYNADEEIVDEGS